MRLLSEGTLVQTRHLATLCLSRWNVHEQGSSANLRPEYVYIMPCHLNPVRAQWDVHEHWWCVPFTLEKGSWFAFVLNLKPSRGGLLAAFTRKVRRAHKEFLP
jgi:hypothetical protein